MFVSSCGCLVAGGVLLQQLGGMFLLIALMIALMIKHLEIPAEVSDTCFTPPLLPPSLPHTTHSSSFARQWVFDAMAVRMGISSLTYTSQPYLHVSWQF